MSSLTIGGLVTRELALQVAHASLDAFGSGDDIQKEANGLRYVSTGLQPRASTWRTVPHSSGTGADVHNCGRRIGWVSFWLQLALSIVSAIVLFFTATTASRGMR